MMQEIEMSFSGFQSESDINRRYWWTCQVWQYQILCLLYRNEALSLFGIGCLDHLKGIVHLEIKSHYLLTLISSQTRVSFFHETQKQKSTIKELCLLYVSSIQKSYDGLNWGTDPNLNLPLRCISQITHNRFWRRLMKIPLFFFFFFCSTEK